eukprot:GHVQ01014389.1.p1 GENE.GHVQ01014389.1~~GHVQ01014389.1.p1  ORF type:complete len:532 (+),score=84.49 GHVQ01014389.1:140-1735(+)
MSRQRGESVEGGTPNTLTKLRSDVSENTNSCTLSTSSVSSISSIDGIAYNAIVTPFVTSAARSPSVSYNDHPSHTPPPAQPLSSTPTSLPCSRIAVSSPSSSSQGVSHFPGPSPSFSVPTSFSGGQQLLTKSTKRHIASLLAICRRAPEFLHFLEPVDVVRYECPDYYNVIKSPMDLLTIERKLLDEMYCDKEAVLKDFFLIFSNCRLYNESNDYLMSVCSEAEVLFQQEWKRHILERQKIGEPLKSHTVSSYQTGGARNSKHSSSSTHRRICTDTLAPELQVRVASDSPCADMSTGSSYVALPKEKKKKDKTIKKEKKNKKDKDKLSDKHEFSSSFSMPVIPSDSCYPFAEPLPQPKSISPAFYDTDKKAKQKKLKQSTSPSALSETSSYPSCEPEPASPPQSRLSASTADFPKRRGARPLGKSWTELCAECVDVMSNTNSYSYMFEMPVLENSELPDDIKANYRKEIPYPMDYYTVKKKLKSSAYQHPSQFHEDMGRIYDNCMKFNPSSGQHKWIHIAGRRNQQHFFKL